MDRVYHILEESGADDFLVRETHTRAREAFFIGQKLDMGRAKEVTHTTVTVYVDSEDGTLRGSATKEIHPSGTEEELRQEVAQAVFAAQFARNPWYPIAEASSFDGPQAGNDLNEELAKIVKAMQAVRAGENEKVNSYEIFVNQTRTHIRNSRGVDVSFSSVACELEVVVNARKNGHEIELYKDFRFSKKPAEEITAEVEALFAGGRDRLNAAPTTQHEHAGLILSGDAVAEFFKYFVAHSNVANKYMGYARGEVGTRMTGGEADPLNICLVPVLPGSTKNEPYDADGRPVIERTLYENGVLKSFWGALQYAHYLGVGDTTTLNNAVISGGSQSKEQLYAMPHLEVRDFSDFLMDPISGNFGGEIRLGYESDGTSCHPVSGGSVSGNYEQALQHMQFSRETKQIDNFIVPKVVFLPDVSVAGN